MFFFPLLHNKMKIMSSYRDKKHLTYLLGLFKFQITQISLNSRKGSLQHHLNLLGTLDYPVP